MPGYAAKSPLARSYAQGLAANNAYPASAHVQPDPTRLAAAQAQLATAQPAMPRVDPMNGQGNFDLVSPPAPAAPAAPARPTIAEARQTIADRRAGRHRDNTTRFAPNALQTQHDINAFHAGIVQQHKQAAAEAQAKGNVASNLAYLGDAVRRGVMDEKTAQALAVSAQSDHPNEFRLKVDNSHKTKTLRQPTIHELDTILPPEQQHQQYIPNPKMTGPGDAAYVLNPKYVPEPPAKALARRRQAHVYFNQTYGQEAPQQAGPSEPTPPTAPTAPTPPQNASLRQAESGLATPTNDLPTPKTSEDYQKIPHGSRYVHPDGTVRFKS